ncbi:hypothetical protein ABBQ32_000706 [Trebouxia sp. C0010 RCD-2024]
MQNSSSSQAHGSETLSLKEKNRRAQRKFREKQRAKKSQAEGQAFELAQQLQELKAQKAAAYSRNLALEKVFELQKLQEKDKSQVSEASRPSSVDHTQANALIASELASPPRSNSIHMSVDVNTLTRFCGRQPVPMTRFSKSQIEQFEFADFAKLWKEYISRLAVCLVEANGDDSSPACQTIHEIMAELTAVFCYVCASHPHKMLSFHSSKLEEGPSSWPAANDELWQTIAAAANFSDEQQARICGIRDYFLARMMRIMKEREDISAQLAAAVPPFTSRIVTAGMNMQAAAGHIQALQATEKLHQNLHQAQDCLSQFQVAARECMTPLQVAMVCVQSFPWMPDIVGLFSSVADNREEHALAAEHSD